MGPFTALLLCVGPFAASAHRVHNLDDSLHNGLDPTDAFSSTLSPEPVPLPRAKLAAIFLDYDGCGDILSPTNPANYKNGEWWTGALKKANSIHSNHSELAGYLMRAFEQIGKGRDKVILFVGSNRQDKNTDEANANKWNNGLALGKNGGFQRLWRKYKDKGWALNKVLLADNGEPGSAWDNKDKTYHWENDEVVKREIAENNFNQLQGRGPVDVFFIDDKKPYIDYVRHHAKVPEGIRFYSIHYDWYDYATENLTDELVAEDVEDHKHFLWM